MCSCAQKKKHISKEKIIVLVKTLFFVYFEFRDVSFNLFYQALPQNPPEVQAVGSRMSFLPSWPDGGSGG